MGSNQQPPSPKANTVKLRATWDVVVTDHIYIFGKYLCYQILLTGVYV